MWYKPHFTCGISHTLQLHVLMSETSILNVRNGDHEEVKFGGERDGRPSPITDFTVGQIIPNVH